MYFKLLFYLRIFIIFYLILISLHDKKKKLKYFDSVKLFGFNIDFIFYKHFIF